MRSTHAKLLVGALTIGATVSSAAAAQAGFDPTYGVSGIASVAMSATSGDRFLGSTPGSGGTTFAVGFTTAPGSPDQLFAVAKLRSDGSRDAEFGIDGVASVNVRPGPFAAPPANPDMTVPATPTGTQEVARGVVIQSDGKIVIAGQAETPAGGADSRDTDVYAARFNANGTLDTTYGGANSPNTAIAGVSRIDMTDGDADANTLVSDQGWGAVINSDDTVVIEAARGTDIGAAPLKTDRDVAMIKLTPSGALDPSFNGGAGGVAGISIAGNTVSGRPLNDNARRPKLTTGGRIVASSYGSAGAVTGPPALPSIPNVPAVYRFLPNGALDTSYSTDGIATGTPLGAAPAFSEAYDVGVQEGERYVLTGYGNTGTTGSTVDMVAYRFKANGDLDPSFGTGGVTRFDAGIGQEDRGRDMNVTSEGRIVIAGSSAQGAGDLIAAVYLLRPNGQFETTFGTGGVQKVDFGGTGDAFFGISDTTSDTRATIAGYRSVTPTTGDDARIVRLNIDLENTGPAGAAGPVGPQGLPGPAGDAGATGATGATGAPGSKGAKGSKGSRGLRGRSGASVIVTCRLVGSRTIRCTTRTRSVKAAGAVSMHLSRNGRVVARGTSKLRRGSSSVNLIAKAGSYTLVGRVPVVGGKHKVRKQRITGR